eukprot:COSAG06_NODE_2272_length_7196_cov_4.916314_10_plen_116_part_00
MTSMISMDPLTMTLGAIKEAYELLDTSEKEISTKPSGEIEISIERAGDEMTVTAWGTRKLDDMDFGTRKTARAPHASPCESFLTLWRDVCRRERRVHGGHAVRRSWQEFGKDVGD